MKFLYRDIQETQNNTQQVEQQKQDLQSQKEVLEEHIAQWLQTNKLPEKINQFRLFAF